MCVVMLSREKYPLWVVTRTERHPPCRTRPGAVLDEDGCCEYSFLPCIHECGKEVRVVTDQLRRSKSQAIDDHLSTCIKVPEADRPKKRQRGGMSITAIVDPQNAERMLPIHARCRQELKDVEQRLEERISRLESKSTMYDQVLSVVLPSLELPLKQDVAQLQLTCAIQADITHTLVARPSSQTRAIADLAELRYEHECLERKYELLKRKLDETEREKASLQRDNVRIQSGSELRMQERLVARQTAQVDACDECIRGIKKVICEEAVGNDMFAYCVARVKKAVDAMEAKRDSIRRQHRSDTSCGSSSA